jgi:hypothetical protein
MSTTLDPVAAAIAEAQAKAAALIAAQAAQVPAVAPQAAANAVAPVRPGKPLTMDDMAAGTLQVDAWIGVKEHGFLIGQDKDLYTEQVKVSIDLAAVAPHKAVKFGNPPTYLKSYDGITCAQGGSWEAALARAARVDQNAREYSSADVPMVLRETLVKGKKTLIEEGKTVGYSLSTTNWPAWRAFWQAAVNKGLAGQVVNATLGYEKRTNKNGNIWGIITFTLED